MSPKALLLAAIAALALAPAPARAIDCAKASRADERLICADPGLKTLDAELNGTYAAVLAKRPGPERETLRVLQTRWLRRRNACAGEGEAECLGKAIRARIAFLRDADGESPGKGRLTFVRAGTPPRPGMDDDPQGITFRGYRFAVADTPARATVNAMVDKQMRWASGRPVASGAEDDCKTCYERRDMGISQVGDMISVSLTVDSYTGGAHGGFSTTNWTYRLDRSDQVEPSELFDGEALARLARACAKEIAGDDDGEGLDLYGQEAEDETSRPLSDSFTEAFGKGSNWSWDAKGVTVGFGLYVLTTYAGGAQTCRLDADMLSREARAPFPFGDAHPNAP